MYVKGNARVQKSAWVRTYPTDMAAMILLGNRDDAGCIMVYCTYTQTLGTWKNYCGVALFVFTCLSFLTPSFTIFLSLYLSLSLQHYAYNLSYLSREIHACAMLGVRVRERWAFCMDIARTSASDGIGSDRKGETRSEYFCYAGRWCRNLWEFFGVWLEVVVLFFFFFFRRRSGQWVLTMI